MVSEDELKQFMRFLKDNCAYHAYLEEVNDTRQKYFNLDTIELIMSAYSPRNILAGTLLWSSTKQGHEYWAKLDEKLRIYFNDNDSMNYFEQDMKQMYSDGIYDFTDGL